MAAGKRILYKAVVVAIVLASLPAAGMSQVKGRTVEGVVVDNRSNPLPNVIVYLENTVSLLVESYITQQDGHYRFQNVNSDIDYTLWTRYRRYQSKKIMISKFNSGRHLKMDLIIPVE